MEPINLSIKFVREISPIPDPMPGNDVSSGSVQTGDFLPIFIFAMLALVVVGVACFLFWWKGRIITANHATGSAMLSLKVSSTATKIGILVSLIISTICLICGCYFVKAFASNEAGPLVPDKTEILASVADDGTFHIDPCILTNIQNRKYSIEKSQVIIADEVMSLEGLNDTDILVRGFDGTVFKGFPSSVSHYTPLDLNELDEGKSTTLKFDINFSNPDIIEQLLDRQVFKLLLYPIKEIEYKRIYFNVDGYKYLPVFNSVPTGVTFYGSDGIKTYDSMNENIDFAIVPEGTTIPTVRAINNVTWDNVFIAPDSDVGKSPGVKEDFKNNFLVKNSSGEYLEDIPLLVDPSGEYSMLWGNNPKIYEVGIDKIYRSYNPPITDPETGDITFSKDKFGGETGYFFSAVAYSSTLFRIYDSRLVSWMFLNRDITSDGYNLVVCRNFTA